MSNITKKDRASYITNRAPFQGSNCHGVAYDNGEYAVYSYDTEVAHYSPAEGWMLNERKYSTTTTQLQNQIRRAVYGGE